MLSLRPATAEHLAFCESLSRSNMAAYHAARGIAWEPQLFLASWAEFENFLIYSDDMLVGLLRMLAKQDTLEIRDLQLAPSHTGKGIGTWAIGRATTMAAERGIPQLRLRVLEENPAHRLYLRLGFKAAGSVDGKVLMTLAVPPNRSFKPNPPRYADDPDGSTLHSASDTTHGGSA